MTSLFEARLRQIESERKIGNLLIGAAAAPLALAITQVSGDFNFHQKLSLTFSALFLTVSLVISSLISFYATAQENRLLSSIASGSKLDAADLQLLHETRPKLSYSIQLTGIIGYAGGYSSMVVYLFISLWYPVATVVAVPQ